MSQRRRTLLLSLVLVPLVSVGLYYGSVSIFRQRCAWVTCDPLTWSEIQALGRAAADQRNPDYRIETVFVDLMTGTPNPALGPLPLTVEMHYADPNPIPDRGGYPIDQLTIDPQARTWSWKTWSVGEAPIPDGQARFDRARIGPQEVYALTWERAQQALGAPGSFAAIMVLIVPEGQSWRSELTWAIDYYGEGTSVAYYVDAETGALVERERRE